MSEESAQLSPKDELLIKTIRSFSHRWGILSRVLAKTKGVQGITTFQAKLAAQHMKAAQELMPHLKKEDLSRVTDFATEDAEMIRICLSSPHRMKFDEVREMFQKKFIRPAPEPEQEPLPAVRDEAPQETPEGAGSPSEASAPKREISPEEESDYRRLAALLAIAELRRSGGIHPNLLHPKERELMEHIQSMRPSYGADEVENFVAYLKATVGDEFPWDDFDNDIPF